MWCEGSTWADYLMQIQFVNAVVGALPSGRLALKSEIFTLSHSTAGSEPSAGNTCIINCNYHEVKNIAQN